MAAVWHLAVLVPVGFWAPKKLPPLDELLAPALGERPKVQDWRAQKAMFERISQQNDLALASKR